MRCPAALAEPSHVVGPDPILGMRGSTRLSEPWGHLNVEAGPRPDERLSGERLRLGQRRMGGSHRLGHRAVALRPPDRRQAADSLPGLAVKSARDVGVATLLCVRERPGARADRGGAGRGHGGGRQVDRRPPGPTMTSPYYAEVFHPAPERCFPVRRRRQGRWVPCPLLGTADVAWDVCCRQRSPLPGGRLRGTPRIAPGRSSAAPGLPEGRGSPGDP
jgi:hypothetical protein